MGALESPKGQGYWRGAQAPYKTRLPHTSKPCSLFLSVNSFLVIIYPLFERVVVLHHADLVCYHIFRLLILYVFLHGLLVASYRAHIIPTTPKVPIPVLVFQVSKAFSKSLQEYLPFIYPYTKILNKVTGSYLRYPLAQRVVFFYKNTSRKHICFPDERPPAPVCPDFTKKRIRENFSAKQFYLCTLPLASPPANVFTSARDTML